MFPAGAQTQQKLDKIRTLIDCGGQITADRDATVAAMELKAGDKIPDGEQIKLAVGALCLIGEVDKEKAQMLQPGSAMYVKPAGQQRRVEAKILTVNQMWDAGTAQFKAQMPEGEGRLGGGASFTVNMESGVYSCVIPIEALREDNRGFFCLAAEPKKTILGQEMTAVRIHVEVLEKSSAYAAVSGPVTTEMKLITSTNKSVAEGDRVRVEEE